MPAEPGEERSKGLHLTPTDKRVAFVAMLVLLGLLYWLFLYFRDNARYVGCQSNMHRIYTALQLYMLDSGDRLPPAYVRGENGEVALDSKGRPRTWVTSLVGRVGDPKVFRCPAAGPEEHTVLTNPEPVADAGDILLTYGMFVGVAGADRNRIERAAATALIADSVAGGRASSFDPLPMAGGNDGFLLGFDNSNERADGETRRITRLGVRRTDAGKPWAPGNTHPRHPHRGIVMLFVDGHVEALDPDLMFLNVAYEERPNLWSVPGAE
ncbi:MAG: hypothetical protein HRF45_06120 [Fimbriimonadia bacterium]|jgi:prepilin-type processing-associated H-X9-DG protein